MYAENASDGNENSENPEWRDEIIYDASCVGAYGWDIQIIYDEHNTYE